MNLTDDAMQVSLRITAWSGRLYDRQASNHVAVHHEASTSAGRYNKRLLPKAAFAALTATVSACRTAHYEQTLPWPAGSTRDRRACRRAAFRRNPSRNRAWRRPPSSSASARSAAWSSRSAALRSAFAASRMQRTLTGGSGARSESAVQAIQKESCDNASNARLSASAGAPWIARVTAGLAGRGRCRCARPRVRGSSRTEADPNSPR